MIDEKYHHLAQGLVDTVHYFHQKGWSPATSTNYSLRLDSDQILVSRSGVDKNLFQLQDLLLVDSQGSLLPPFNSIPVKCSAETQIHLGLYRRFSEAHCVLHTHSVLGTALSQAYLQEGKLEFSGLEILKGLEGNTTHLLTEVVPIVSNSQDMNQIMESMKKHFLELPHLHGFLIAGHGLYTWGKDLATAKRHIETFEFLFECFYTMRRL